MKDIINISKPCHENWNSMSAKTDGRYCDSCEKVVTDFTRMSDEELTSFMQGSKQGACGRFREDQVNVLPKKGFDNFKLKMAASFALIFTRFLFSSEAKAQDASNVETAKGNAVVKKLFGDSVVYHITGMLTNKKTSDGIGYAAVKVEVNGLPVGGSTYTDANGKYELNVAVKNSSEVISLSFEKRFYKTLKIENYTPDGKAMQVKLHQTYKGRHNRQSHYVMGRYLL